MRKKSKIHSISSGKVSIYLKEDRIIEKKIEEERSQMFCGCI